MISSTQSDVDNNHCLENGIEPNILDSTEVIMAIPNVLLLALSLTEDEAGSKEKIAKARQKANDLMKTNHFTSNQQKRLQTLKQTKHEHQLHEHQHKEQHSIASSSPLLTITQIESGSHSKISPSKSLIVVLLLLLLWLHRTTPLLMIPVTSTNVDSEEENVLLLSLKVMAFQWIVNHASGVILTMTLYSFVFWSARTATLLSDAMNAESQAVHHINQSCLGFFFFK